MNEQCTSSRINVYVSIDRDNQKIVSTAEAVTMAKKVNVEILTNPIPVFYKLTHQVKAVKYLECSAKTGEGVKAVFEEAIMEALAPKKKEEEKRGNKCVLL